ncbi:MAG TPA: rod shape-determining protein MreC [Candidatus Paceibacterota bacterium]
MMTIYLKPSRKKWQRKTLMRSALVLLMLIILFVLNIYPPNFLRHSLIILANPFWQTRDWTNSLFKTMFAPFVDKNKLLKENSILKTELERKNLALATLKDLAVENQEFKELGGRNVNESFVLAAILNRPPISPYDTFIIDIGSDKGIAIGDIAAVDKNSIIGEISSIAKNSAVVSLYSTPDQETQVAVGVERAEAPARGRGGGNFEIRLPKNIVVEIADAITLPSINHRLLGFVSKIYTGTNDPFQTILFGLPINLNTLRFVMILKK